VAGVNGNVATLYGSIGQVDAAPTEAQKKATADAHGAVGALLKQWDEIRKSDLHAANQQLRNAGLAEIALDSKPSGEDAETDIE
jgi:hypothetical protein